MTEFFDHWDKLLDGQKSQHFDGRPQGGLYALWVGRNKPKSRVRIDKVDEQIVCWVNGEVRTDINPIWRQCGGNAVSPEAYDHHEKNGDWPGEVIAAAPTMTLTPTTTSNVPADTGLTVSLSNNPPPEATHELLPYMTAQLKDWFAKIGAFTDKRHVEEAANQVDSLRKLVGTARKAHKEEKDPHLEAGRVVDRKYLDAINAADLLMKTVGNAVANWASAQMAKEREAAAAKQALDEAKAKDVLTEAVGKSPEEQIAAMKAAAELVVKPAAPPPAPVKVTNSMGKGGFNVKIKKVAEIVDQDALYAAVRNDLGLQQILLTLAQMALDGGTTLPGVRVVEKTVAGAR